VIYKVLHFDGETRAVVWLQDTSKATRLRKLLSENGLKACAADGAKTDLLIFLAFDGVDNDFLIKHLLNPYRDTSERDKATGTINHYSGDFIPILIICEKEEQTIKRNFGIQYWDSSIWQRWLVRGIPEEENDKKYEKNLIEILGDIKNYWISGRYSSPVTKEFCEFSTRIYRNSYLLETGENGHANGVVPFPFFQEGKFKRDFLDELTKNHNYLSELEWRILLVDDKADDGKTSPDPATSAQPDPSPGSSPSNSVDERRQNTVSNKLLLIKNLLEENFSVRIEEKNPSTYIKRDGAPSLHIEYAENVAKALKKMEYAHFDIILLDYLLGQEPGQLETRELGIKLLEEIKNPEVRKKLKIGPNNRFWIFSVTSFSWAFIDHLREKGLSQFSVHWTFTRGADPINTPNAFLYYFVDFLISQFKVFKSDITLKSIWIKALDDLSKDQNFKRMWANTTLNAILSYWNQIESLRELKPDKLNEKPSHLATSFLASNFYNDEVRQEYNSGLYGYLTHFLFMLSFSDGYEWEEMKTDLEMIMARIPAVKRPTVSGYRILQKRIEALQELYIK
jgi:hypothetical protein